MKRLALAAILATLTLQTSPADEPKQVDSQCLASAIVHEAGGEPMAGKRAVFEVIQNRMKESNTSACGIITAKGQFSWYGYKPILPYTDELKELMRKVKSYPKILNSEKWFFGTKIKTPKWARDMECRVIGNHRFCKEGEE